MFDPRPQNEARFERAFKPSVAPVSYPHFRCTSLWIRHPRPSRAAIARDARFFSNGPSTQPVARGSAESFRKHMRFRLRLVRSLVASLRWRILPSHPSVQRSASLAGRSATAFKKTAWPRSLASACLTQQLSERGPNHSESDDDRHAGRRRDQASTRLPGNRRLCDSGSICDFISLISSPESACSLAEAARRQRENDHGTAIPVLPRHPPIVRRMVPHGERDWS
ncbi:hypothetical protein DM48_3299 [Burkholderia gladioli]|uniref:Uncharacterized protein n=1 Tax=Burkholderia gladioli TaxID=28095 RepID=A0AAW3F8E3_BURGA|nr:hypothetical protein DM48_3299 [Burkholderia gladioli]SPU96266.1 Uncharacterised protein [Burkholderia gladioli]